MPLVPRFQLLGHGDPSSSNDRDLYSTPDGYRYMKGDEGYFLMNFFLKKKHLYRLQR
jgi:hypothetical protein